MILARIGDLRIGFLSKQKDQRAFRAAKLATKLINETLGLVWLLVGAPF